MIRQSHQPPSARDVVRVLFRHRRKGTIFFIAVVAVAVAGVLLMPRKYRSEAQLLVKVNLRMDPAATDDGQAFAYDTEREAEMLSVVELLQSRQLFEQVVDQLGVEVATEADLASSPLTRFTRWLFAPPASDSPQARERAVQQLMRTLEIHHPRKTHVVGLAYKSRSPARAQQVLAAYVAAATQHHLEVNKNPDSYAFFVEQESLLQGQVLEARQSLRDAKNQLGLVSVASQRNVLEGHITTLDRQLLDLQTELVATEDRITALRDQLPFELQRPAAANAFTERSLDEMRNQLYTLEIGYRELLSRLRDAHPHVIAMREQVAAARQDLNHQQLLNELSRAQFLKSRLAALQSDHESTQDKLQQLNADEVRIAELERRAEELTASHRVYVRKLEQARLDLQLGSDQISNLRLAQTPTFMAKPLSRKGTVILGLAVVVGLLGAVSLAYVCELLDESLATPADVETSLELPVLMSLPRARSHQPWLN